MPDKIPAIASPSAWTNVFAAANAYRQQHLGKGLPAGKHGGEGAVKVKNLTGANRREGDVVSIGDSLLNELEAQHLWFGGLAPDAALSFGVLSKALPNNDIGPCTVSGVCIAYVNINDTSHRFANVQAAQYSFESAATGNVEILYQPGGTGEQKCVVRFPVGATQSTPVRIRLTADLALGGSANAKLLAYNGSAWVTSTQTITVYDWLNTQPQAVRTGMFRGKVGHEGWAFFRQAATDTPGDQDKYDLIWLEHKALFVRFTLTDPVTNQNTATAATFSSDTFFQGRDPNAGVESGAIDVYDVDLTFLNAPAGAEGLAVYNDTNEHYEIVYVQMPVVFGEATLSATLSAGQDASISSFASHPFGFYMLDPDPLPTTAENPCNHIGESGDKVLLRSDNWGGRWIVIDVTKKTQTFVTDVQVSGTTLQKKTRSCAVESNAAESAWTTFHTGASDCP